VGAGKSYLSPLISRFILEEYMRLRRGGAPSDSPLRTLTGREREIFDLSVRGLSNDTISAQLTISKRTVETHRGRIMRKLGVHSAADLVRVAARHGLLQV
jgi:two-component system response regulator NreC